MWLALLAATARIAQLQPAAAAVPEPSAHTPSGAVPPHEKPAVDKRRKKKPGAKPGHRGSRRETPQTIDHQAEHRLERCPCCGGDLQRCNRTRTRITIDIPVVRAETTEHTLHRDYCPACRQHVEPVVPDAMPNAVLGHNLVALSAWFHYGLGVTIGQVRDIFSTHLHTLITSGGLVYSWQRMAGTLEPWYQQIMREAKQRAVLHADETGWRVDGQTWWLWCFANHDTCCYLIDQSRGGPALRKFFTEAYRGTLVTDFWAAYEQVACDDKQRCLPHLLRDVIKTDEHNINPDWQRFSKLLRRLVKDGIRLRKRHDFCPQRYRSRIHLIHRRLCRLADEACGGLYADADARRLGERISRHRDQLFTFLDTPEVPADNNHAERQIRPAVIIRKNSLCNRSTTGADTQAILMSVYRTLRLRGHDPTKTVANALRELLKTGTLPPLPPCSVADG